MNIYPSVTDFTYTLENGTKVSRVVGTLSSFVTHIKCTSKGVKDIISVPVNGFLCAYKNK